MEKVFIIPKILLAVVLFLFFAFLGNICIGYSLETWAGKGVEWYSVNIFLRLLLGFVVFKIAIPVAIISFLLSLVINTPIL